MKPTSPHPAPLDELLAAALHGELTADERAALDVRLAADPAARAAYQEIQHMHDLLEKNYRDAQPDPAFEDRMISAVRRKVQAEKEHRETAWESAVVLWHAVTRPFGMYPRWTAVATACAILLLLVRVSHGPITAGIKRSGHAVVSNPFQIAGEPGALPILRTEAGFADALSKPTVLTKSGEESTRSAIRVFPYSAAMADTSNADKDAPMKRPVAAPSSPAAVPASIRMGPALASGPSGNASPATSAPSQRNLSNLVMDQGNNKMAAQDAVSLSMSIDNDQAFRSPKNIRTDSPAPATTNEPSRKLVRDAQLDLEVKGYQKSVDAITARAKAGGGYLDSTNSQRGGNGKLQGTVVVKVLPENLDEFLLKLRDLGDIKNQSVSTEDVTKAYYDTQARLGNSRRMETQLQELLKRDNGKVSDLLQVERELGRVRGDIEQMQGQLKLYDFQVQYATVTIAVAEKDLNQAAAYLLREHDTFSLFVHDVEGAFAQAKAAADASKAEILDANLQHNSGSDLSATLAFSVPPDQIDGFLNRIRGLGRVDNFTRQTQRVANDGGDASAPAGQTRTEKDPVQVTLTIRADDESARQQTQIAVISTGDIDAQAQQLKLDAATLGVSVTGSNFQRAPDGGAVATLTFRLPLAKVPGFMPALEKLGRVESLTVQRDDRPGQAAADANAPAEITLSLHNVPALENQAPCQQTELTIASRGDVDSQAQQVKLDAVKAGAAVTTSSFDRSPDGTETATLSFRLPLAKAADFMATLNKLGRVESLAVQRNDQPGRASNDPTAPAQIDLRLHNQTAMIADNNGLWATLRRTFGHGAGAFLRSVQTIGVIMAFVLPWLVALTVVAWIGRRIYIAQR